MRKTRRTPVIRLDACAGVLSEALETPLHVEVRQEGTFEKAGNGIFPIENSFDVETADRSNVIVQLCATAEDVDDACRNIGEQPHPGKPWRSASGFDTVPDLIQVEKIREINTCAPA